MRRIEAIVLTSLLGLTACEKQSADTATPDDAAAAAADAEAKKKAEQEAAAEAERKKAEEEEAAKKEAQKKRLAEATIRMEAEYEKEAARWDAKLKKSVAKLVAKNHKTTKKALQAAMKSAHREPGNKDRDMFRHPVETFEFLGLTPEMTVVEVSPGAGWYTELLAVVVHKNGKLVIPSFDSKSEEPLVAYFGRGDELLLGKSEELFGKVERVVNPSFEGEKFTNEPATADMVLVFRMMHNWHRSKQWDQKLKAVNEALKPGGVFAVVQHRAPEGGDPDEWANKGYLPQAFVIETVEAAGFKLEAQSEVNANAKDTKDYPNGVWNLPPTLRDKDKDKDKYVKIGESDRMTLKFVKQ